MRIFTLTFLFTGLLQILIAQPEAIFDVHFDTDISALSTAAEATIIDKTSTINKPIDYRVRLIGHTDQRGSWDYNKALSERRANSVKERLESLGFSAENISWEGLSYDDPVDTKETEAAWTKNRRVDIIIEKASWNVPASYYTVDASNAQVLTYDRSGTTIDVPANAFMDKNGNPVEGDVLIYYREFRDFADFMSSDLPMNFQMDGEDVYFNSTGMFEVKAYQGEEELSLQPGKNIGLDFVQSQVLKETQFWRFDENSGQWENGSSSIVSQDGHWKDVPVDTVERKFCKTRLRTTEVSLSKLKSTIPLTLALIDSAAHYDDLYIPQFDGTKYRNRFNEKYGRYAGMHYVGHLTQEEIENSIKYSNIEMKRLGVKNGAIFFTLKDLTNDNPELAAFEGAIWEFKRANNYKARDFSVSNRRWTDIRIYQGQKKKIGKGSKFTYKKPFRIKLKQAHGHVEILAYLKTFKGKEKISRREAKLAYKAYSDVFRARKRAFDDGINNNMLAIQDYWTYFKVLAPRYYPVPFNLVSGMDCDCFYAANSYTSKDREEHPCYRFFLDKIIYLDQHFKDLDVQQMSDEKLAHYVSDFDGLITTDKVLYESVFQEFSEEVPSLNLSALGKFNLDVLKRFKDQEKVFASFEDEAGKSIDFKKIDVINYNLNGLLTFTKPSIYLDLGAPTTIVVYGKNDKLYAINPDGLASLDLKNKRAFTFTVRELKDGINDPQELRDALAYN